MAKKKKAAKKATKKKATKKRKFSLVQIKKSLSIGDFICGRISKL